MQTFPLILHFLCNYILCFAIHNDCMNNLRQLVIAYPNGFCAGVARAINAASNAIHVCDGPIFCLNEIVHNQFVIDELREKGIIFSDTLSSIPDGAVVIFSAHGVPPPVRKEALMKNLHIIDATCPFVTKVHSEVKQFTRRGYTILLIGNKNHEEIIGVRGECPELITVIEDITAAENITVPDEGKVAVLMQTTLSTDDTGEIIQVLRKRFPGINEPAVSDICYATQNRQEAVRRLAQIVQFIIVLGAINSANSKRLVAVAEKEGCRAVLVPDNQSLEKLDLNGIHKLGLTAGASTPAVFIEDTVKRLATSGFSSVEKLITAEESTHFALPKDCRK